MRDRICPPYYTLTIDLCYLQVPSFGMEDIDLDAIPTAMASLPLSLRTETVSTSTGTNSVYLPLYG